jgi:hypothetical protein
MKIKRLDAKSYEMSSDRRDFHIRAESRTEDKTTWEVWQVDMFDSSVQDNEDAYLDTQEFPTLDEAIDYCFEFAK